MMYYLWTANGNPSGSYGKTGAEVTRLGFGVMRLPTRKQTDWNAVNFSKSVPLLRSAMEAGVNFFDSHHGYHGGNSEVAIGRVAARRYVRAGCEGCHHDVAEVFGGEPLHDRAVMHCPGKDNLSLWAAFDGGLGEERRSEMGCEARRELPSSCRCGDQDEQGAGGLDCGAQGSSVRGPKTWVRERSRFHDRDNVCAVAAQGAAQLVRVLWLRRKSPKRGAQSGRYAPAFSERLTGGAQRALALVLDIHENAGHQLKRYRNTRK